MKPIRDIGHFARQTDNFWTLCDMKRSKVLPGAFGVGDSEQVQPPYPPLANLSDVALVRLVARYLGRHLEKDCDHARWDQELEEKDLKCTVRLLFLFLYVGTCDTDLKFPSL